MKKITALFFTIISILFFSQSTSHASDLYSASLTRDIYIDNHTEYNVVNTFALKNISNTFLIKSFDYFSPLPFTLVEATIEGSKLSVIVEGSHIIINLGEKVLRPLKDEVLIIKLRVPELAKPVRANSGEVLGAELFLPKDSTKSLELLCQTTVNYDKDLFNPSYISTEYQIEEGKIFFTKNVDVFVDFTQIAGFKIKYQGESGKILLPSSIFSKVIYNNLPQGGLLSSDMAGNVYFEKNGVIQYDLIGYKRPKIDLAKSQEIYYYAKEDLSEFRLEDEVKGLYRQVIDKYSPDTQGFSTKMESPSEYAAKDFNDSLAYSLTLASLIKQKEIPAEVVFGKVKFPLSQEQVWHFWVLYYQDDLVKQIDPYMEDLLGFDGFEELSKQRAIMAGYFNDPAFINSINNLINDKTELEFVKGVVGGDTSESLARLDVVRVPDSLYPKIKFIYTNLNSSPIKITGISLNGIFNSFQDIEILPGSQKEFEISLGINIFDIVLKKGDIKISAQVMDGGIQRVYDTNTSVTPQALLWIVMVNFVSVFVGVALILIFARYKRKKIN